MMARLPRPSLAPWHPVPPQLLHSMWPVCCCTASASTQATPQPSPARPGQRSTASSASAAQRLRTGSESLSEAWVYSTYCACRPLLW